MSADPLRFRVVRPVDPAHRVPVPGRAIALAAAGEPVDTYDSYWIMALADRSVELVPTPAAAPAAAPPQIPAPPK